MSLRRQSTWLKIGMLSLLFLTYNNCTQSGFSAKNVLKSILSSENSTSSQLNSEVPIQLVSFKTTSTQLVRSQNFEFELTLRYLGTSALADGYRPFLHLASATKPEWFELSLFPIPGPDSSTWLNQKEVKFSGQILIPSTASGTYQVLVGVNDGSTDKVTSNIALQPPPTLPEVYYPGAIGYRYQVATLSVVESSTPPPQSGSGSTGGDFAERQAWARAMIYDAQNEPDARTLQDGSRVPSEYGGHLVTSFASIEGFMREWSTNPPFPNDPPGGAHLKDLNAPYPNDPQDGSRFTKNVSAVIPWYWIWAGAGHNSTNTGVEARNMFAAARMKNGEWRYFFSGARPGVYGNFWRSLGGGLVLPLPGVAARFQNDGITTFYRTEGPYGIEVWPEDTVPSRGVVSFVGGHNRELMANAEVFIWGVQARLVVIDPNQRDDSADSRYLMATGADFGTSLGGRHYDRYGFPYNVMDGGHDRWKFLRSKNWTWITSITLREGHWWVPGKAPPLANWDGQTPFTAVPNSVTADDVLKNPPPLPPYRD